MFNKNENAIHDSDYFKKLEGRDNVILLGDSLGDLKMADGANASNLLKIGFLNDKVGSFYQKLYETRMHSSRMRTGRSLTVCWGRGGLVPGGSRPGGSGPGGIWSGGGVASQHALRQNPPRDRITDACKNITLATTSLRPVKIQRNIF